MQKIAGGWFAWDGPKGEDLKERLVNHWKTMARPRPFSMTLEGDGSWASVDAWDPDLFLQNKYVRGWVTDDVELLENGIKMKQIYAELWVDKRDRG